MWDLPGPGLELVCPALAGGFLTTVPPGKPPAFISFALEDQPKKTVMIDVREYFASVLFWEFYVVMFYI